MTTLYLCGAGNSEGVRLAQALNQRQARWDRIVLLDDDPAKRGLAILGVEVAGPFGLLKQAAGAASEAANLVARTTAKRWSARCDIAGYGVPFTPLIGPDVDLAGVEFGNDVIVYRSATIGPQVSLGDGSVVFMGAIVGHESRLGRSCIVAPNAVINARVQLADGVYVGTNATILPEVKVGPWATIGAGSVATRNVPAGATVMGVPGRIVLTPNLKLRMGGSPPHELWRQMESHASRPSSPPRPGGAANS